MTPTIDQNQTRQAHARQLAELAESPGELTIQDKLLATAFSLEQEGFTVFSAALLAVEAWKRWPQTFGLFSFEQTHPDSNKVICVLSHSRGPVKRLLLQPAGPRLYRLTSTGRAIGQRLMEE